MDNRTILGDLKKRLLTEFGADLSRLLVYGSVARGEDTKDSDLGVVVVFHSLENKAEKWDRALSIAADVSFEYETLIEPPPGICSGMKESLLSAIAKAQESLAVARELHRGGHYDFAVSRAYYA